MCKSDVAFHRIAIADPPLRSGYVLHQPYAKRPSRKRDDTAKRCNHADLKGERCLPRW